MARVGKYVLTDDMGSRGRARLQSALDPVIGRPLALLALDKETIAADGPDALQAEIAHLQAQARAQGSLHHPNIVTVYEYGEDARHAWLALELVRGKSLREHLAGGYRPGGEAMPEILTQVLEALDYAHGRGHVHGHLHAGHVLIDEWGVAKLIGFGAALREAAEPDDVRAAAGLARELLAGREAALPALEPLPATIRALINALQAALRPRLALASNVQALRRGVSAKEEKKPAEEARALTRLPAVLFVDDEERVLNALAQLFRGEFDVETAASGAEALDRMRARRFLVVVSDQRMPGMSGVEFLREARKLSPGTVRILLTGYSDLSAIVTSVNESEVFRFASKPWDAAELRATLDEAASVAIAVEAARAGGRDPRQPGRARGAVVVLGEPEIARAARELAGGAYPVLEAADVEGALQAIAQQEVGALVCNLESGAGDPAALLRALKEEAPRTQLVVSSATRDSSLMIGLINEARILRFLEKPASPAHVAAAVGAALERHAAIAAAPALERVESARRVAHAGVRTLAERIRAFIAR